MSHKTELIYKAVFGYIHLHVMSLKCQMFMSDYEKALRNGFLAIVPNVDARCCWFHYCQATKRNAMKIPDMIRYIKNETQAKEIYYQMLSLPLLPAEHISSAFEMLKMRANALNAEVFKNFLLYWKKQWLENVILKFSYQIFSYEKFQFKFLIGSSTR